MNRVRAAISDRPPRPLGMRVRTMRINPRWDDRAGEQVTPRDFSGSPVRAPAATCSSGRSAGNGPGHVPVALAAVPVTDCLTTRHA